MYVEIFARRKFSPISPPATNYFCDTKLAGLGKTNFVSGEENHILHEVVKHALCVLIYLRAVMD